MRNDHNRKWTIYVVMPVLFSICVMLLGFGAVLRADDKRVSAETYQAVRHYTARNTLQALRLSKLALAQSQQDQLAMQIMLLSMADLGVRGSQAEAAIALARTIHPDSPKITAAITQLLKAMGREGLANRLIEEYRQTCTFNCVQ